MQTIEQSKSRRVPVSIDPVTKERKLNFSYMLLSDAQKKFRKLSFKKETRAALSKALYLLALRGLILQNDSTFLVSYYASTIISKLRYAYRQLTIWTPQRLKRGFDDRDLWNLDATIITFIVKFLEPRLKAFREMKSWGYPAYLESQEEWQSILQEILDGFKLIEENGSTHLSIADSLEVQREQEAKMQRSIELFSKHWTNLWD